MSAVALPWVKLHVCVFCSVCQAASKKWTDLQGNSYKRSQTVLWPTPPVLRRSITYYNVLQRTTTYYNVLQRTTTYGNVLQAVTNRIVADSARTTNVLHVTTIYFNVLQRTTTYFNVLQRTTSGHRPYCDRFRPHHNVLQQIPTYYNVLHRTITY